MKRIAIITIAALAVVSCSQKENLQLQGNLRITISPEITKVTGTSFDSQDKIGLDIKQDGETANYLTNAELTYNGTAFTGTDLIWYKGEGTSTLTAYYPYSPEGKPSTWKVATDQSAGYAAYDVLGALRQDVTPSEEAVTMKFRHLLSMITVTIDNQATTRTLSSFTVKGLIPDCALDFETMNSAANGTAAEFTPYKVGAGYELLVPAQTAIVTFSATLSDGSTIEETANSINLKSGSRHNMTVTISDKDLTARFTGDIEDWTVEEEFVFE